MNTILVGVDGSDTAQAAAREAAAFAAAMGAKLHLVSAVQPGAAQSGGVGSDEFTVDSTSDADVMLQRTRKSLPDGLEISGSVVVGKPATAIVDEAARVEADLIVVGNRRMQGVSRVLGSVANDVSHHAPCSVYIAKTT